MENNIFSSFILKCYLNATAIRNSDTLYCRAVQLISVGHTRDWFVALRLPPPQLPSLPPTALTAAATRVSGFSFLPPASHFLPYPRGQCGVVQYSLWDRGSLWPGTAEAEAVVLVQMIVCGRAGAYAECSLVPVQCACAV